MKQSEDLRQKLIDRFVCDNNYLKIEYKRIFGQFSNLNKKQLIDYARSDNSAKNKFNKKGKYVYHILAINGLITLTNEILHDINEFVNE